MNSLGDAISAADGIHARIHAELQRSDNRVQNAQEAKDSAEARQMATSALKSTIKFVESSISKLRAANVPRSCRTQAQKAITPQKNIPQASLEAEAELPEDGKQFLKQISGDEDDGFGSQAPNLEEMAEAIGPIMDNFDEVLQKPYLNNHSAVVNTVPVLGLKGGNQIMYLSVDADSHGINESWKPFGPLPGDAANDPSKVHFFPYKGNLYVAHGQTAWKKSPRARDDPILKEANNDWSKMYVNEWVKVGDDVLPSTDLQSVIPFAKLDDGGDVMSFDLLILEKSGTIKILAKDDIYPSNSWETMSHEGAGSPPKWTRIAYYNQKLIGLDDGNKTWDITVDIGKRSYKPANQVSIDRVTDFTATDTGLVVIREDNYVYRRQVEAPTGGSSEPTDEKQAIALDAAWQEIDQAIIWSDDLFNTLESSRRRRGRLCPHSYIKSRLDLEQQLTLLRDKLKGLEGHPKRSAGGLALGVIGLFFGANPTILKAAGALFVASVVAAVTLGQKISELAKAIADTEAQIRVTSQAIDELSSIVTNYTNLDEMYKQMTAFWGGLNLTAGRVEAFEEAILKQLGKERLSTPANIISARDAMGRILKGADKYLQVLIEQGIELPPKVQVATSYTDLLNSKPPVLLALSFVELVSLRTQEVKDGIQLLARRDFSAYRQRMRNAKAVALLATAAKRRERILTDNWYDIALLQANSEMFALPARNDMKTGDSEYLLMVLRTKQAGLLTVQCLGAVEQMCLKIQDLLDKYPEGQATLEISDPLLDEAIEFCSQAGTWAVMAHNEFAKINQIARDYQNTLEREIREFEIKIQIHRAAMEEEKKECERDYPPPWWTDGRASWISLQKGYVEMRYNWFIIGPIEKNDIAPRRESQKSGIIFDGNSLTWKEMVEKVNGATGEIALSLDRIKKWISMDPVRMKRILDAKWKDIAADTALVREILAGFMLVLKATIASGSDHDHMLDVLSLSPTVIKTISDQTRQLNATVQAIDEAMRLPHVRGLVGQCDNAGSQKTSVLDILAATRNGMTQMTALQGESTRALQLMGSRQRFAIQDVVKGKMSLREFVEYNIDSAVPAQKAAAAAVNQWRDISTQYKSCLHYAQMTLRAMENRLDKIQAELRTAKDKDHARNVKLLADMITQAVLSGEVFMPTKASIQLSAALDTATARNWTFVRTSYIVRTILEALPAAEIDQLVDTFSGLKFELASVVEHLKKLVPVLSPVGEGAEMLESLSLKMTDRMRALLNDGNVVQQLKLTEDDGRKIEQSWIQISMVQN
ncbi:predicted protein [Uncinocarpus reesii 1704]|uniref:Uncharacterized protein n=1 Tax=Uncinocarpus reesii (strain UAMH 1704) TaxID=336963 RepID=C4JN85_UNCRE|nr:uncharacterized protein UREG_04291 [Uncinocarpus reesii 1704]EEP79445.1 predicted protein [Uncinocarpus reesii 1704]